MTRARSEHTEATASRSIRAADAGSVVVDALAAEAWPGARPERSPGLIQSAAFIGIIGVPTGTSDSPRSADDDVATVRRSDVNANTRIVTSATTPADPIARVS